MIGNTKTLCLGVNTNGKKIAIMIILVDDRIDVTAAYRASFGREGVSAASFTPSDFDNWFHSTSGPDLAAVEAFILGDFDRRETLTRVIKTRTEAPAIALNDSTGLESTLKLFAAGADDVVRKPVHAREIIARISAIRRRAAPGPKSATVGDLRVFSDGRDPEVGGSVLTLPRRERRILEYLIANRSRRVSRNQIFNAVYGLFDEEVEESVVESHISKLRKKLRTALGYDPIDTKRYLGYQIVSPTSGAA
jgi:two-component system, OmpR family, flagellar system response regulator FtcR